MARKMALVPIEMLDRIRGNLTPLTNPVKDQVVKGMQRMETILQDDSLPEDVKAGRYNEAMIRHTAVADKLNPPAAVAAVPLSLDSIPRTYRPPAETLMKELERHPEQIKWDPTTREVSLNGRALRGSNIIDLVGHAIRSRKAAPPVHANEFLKALAELNVPEELVRNKNYQNYKNLEPEKPPKKPRKKKRSPIAAKWTPMPKAKRVHAPIKWLPAT